MAELYRLTTTGGIPLCRPTTLEQVTLHIAGDANGWRYVRRTDKPEIVLSLDLQRNTVALHHHGTLVAPSDWPTFLSRWGDWPARLLRVLRISFPNIPDYTEAPTHDHPPQHEGTGPAGDR